MSCSKHLHYPQASDLMLLTNGGWTNIPFSFIPKPSPHPSLTVASHLFVMKGTGASIAAFKGSPPKINITILLAMDWSQTVVIVTIAIPSSMTAMS